MTKTLVWLVEEKKRIIKELREIIGKEGVRKAEKDHHSKRKPRHCGITIHTGIGCNIGCIYCYIWDMGFPGKPVEYPLTPYELAYALAINPYIVPWRTFAAYGSVTEPFLPQTRDKAIRYIEVVWKWLHLPSQVSTKQLLTSDIIEGLKKGDPQISVLVSITSIGEWARKLEPHAPNPLDRIAHAGEAKKKGLETALFIRPIIPGITDKQIDEILDYAWRQGIRDIILGSLRVTNNILKRLVNAGIPKRTLIDRLPRQPRNPREQVTLQMSDLKKYIKMKAISIGFKVHPSACSHNMHSHREPCYACNYGPCVGKPKPPRTSEVVEAIEALGGRVSNVIIKYPVIVLEGLKGNQKVIKEFLSAATRLMVVVGKKRSGPL